MAHRAANITNRLLDEPIQNHRTIANWNSQSVSDFRRASQLNAHWRGLRGEMNSYAGIVRTEAGLNDFLNLVHVRRKMIEAYYWQHRVTRDLIELRNIALLAELIVQSALHRRETRGGHYREDFPHTLPHTEDSILRFAETFPSSTNPLERAGE